LFASVRRSILRAAFLALGVLAMLFDLETETRRSRQGRRRENREAGI
jgi:hypothetical protein